MDFRKPNRMNEYDYSQNDAYFVTICTNERRKILSEIVGDGFPVPASKIPAHSSRDFFIHHHCKAIPWSHPMP